MEKIKNALDIDKKQIVYDGCMVTYTGIIVDLFHPKPDMFCIEDIAHGLAFTCRWNGATKSYFSVAEHCCMMYDRAPEKLKATALMHDSEEAYWGDIIKPLKKLLPPEHRLRMRDMRFMIMQKFGVQYINIDEMDFELLQWDLENLILLNRHIGWDCYTAEKEFLKRFNQLQTTQAH